MHTIWTQLRTLFDPAKIGGGLAILIPKIVVAAVILALFYGLYRLAAGAVELAMSRAKLDRTLQQFVQTVLRYTLLVIAAVMALSHVGIDTSSVLASLGVAGLTLGFAAKDALSNIISGIFIFWDRPFVLGDLVEVGGTYGRVESITLRSTRIVTPDGKMVAIPNATVAGAMVTSYTNAPHLRLDVEVTVAVGEDLDRARAVLLAMLGGDERYMQEPTPSVVVKALNDYNVLLEVRVWIDDERDHIARRFELREQIFRALTDAGVDMPFETIQLAPLDVRRMSEGAAPAAAS